MYPGAHAAAHPDKPAIVMDQSGESVSYAQLEERSVRLANALRDRGLRHGDVVALLAENHVRYFEVYWAAHRCGLYITPVNRHLSPDEVIYQVTDSGARAFIATRQLAVTAAAALPHIPECDVRLMMDGTVDGFDAYEAVLSAASGEQSGPMPRGDALLYSSGTTGRPKGIQRPLLDIDLASPEARGISVFEEFVLGMSPDSVYLCPAPLYHAAGLQFSAGVHELGGTLVVMGSSTRSGGWPSSSASTSRTPRWCRPCWCASSSCPRRSGAATTSPRCSASCTPRRPARSR